MNLQVDALRQIRNSLQSRAEFRLPSSEVLEQLANLVNLFVRTTVSGGTVFFVGVGGCESLARHAAEEYVDSTKGVTLPIRTCWLPLYSGIANDNGMEQAFAMPIRALARPNDLIVAFSTSGNTPSLIRALEDAANLGAHTIAITGANPGILAKVAKESIEVPVPVSEVGRVQEWQLTFIHLILEALIAVGTPEAKMASH